MSVEREQPQITIPNEMDLHTACKILYKYCELAQKVGGTYQLAESEALETSLRVLLGESQDPRVTQDVALRNLIEGVRRGQAHGRAYNMADAAQLHRMITQLLNTIQQAAGTAVGRTEEEVDPELASMSDPVPLMSSDDVKTV